MERYFYFFACSFRRTQIVLKKFFFSAKWRSEKDRQINKECYMVYRQMAAVSSFFAPLPLAGVLCVFMVEREVFH
jgi:hypothetical protein